MHIMLRNYCIPSRPSMSRQKQNEKMTLASHIFIIQVIQFMNTDATANMRIGYIHIYIHLYIHLRDVFKEGKKIKIKKKEEK